MDLTTRYLGLRLRNPLIAGAGPVTGELDNIRRLEDLGAGAVVLPSIFEEQIEAEAATAERLTTAPSESFPEALSYFSSAVAYRTGPQSYLDLVRRAREAVDIPVIASLNGIEPSGWCDYARMVEQAGASAIELNAYFIPSDPALGALQVEGSYVAVLQAVKGAVSIPIAMKLSPYFSAMGAMARSLAEGGADALVLFNRFYQPDIDIAALRLSMDLELSTPAEIRLPLLWIAILHGRVPISLAASTGVESANEVFKYLLAGADAVMTTSSLLRHGVAHMRTLVEGLAALLAAREIGTLDEIRGRMSRKSLKDPVTFERVNYVHILQEFRVPHAG